MSDPAPPPGTSATPAADNAHHREDDVPDTIDLEKEIERVSDLPSAGNELEALLARTPPDLRKILEEEFRAEFLGPVVVDPKKLD